MKINGVQKVLDNQAEYLNGFEIISGTYGLYDGLD
jgi:hypothetical protein